MARRKAELLVEAQGIESQLVAGELDELTLALPAFGNGPFDHSPAKPQIARFRRNAHALDLPPPSPEPRKTGDEAQLQASDDNPSALDDRKILIWIASDRGECLDIARMRRDPPILAVLSENIVCQKFDDPR